MKEPEDLTAKANDEIMNSMRWEAVTSRIEYWRD
jgi:hypothetical protein